MAHTNCFLIVKKAVKIPPTIRLVRVILIIKIYKRLVKNNTTIQLDFLNLKNMFVLYCIVLFENCKSGTCHFS